MARGASDQRKEQIMRSVTYTFAAALLAAVGQFSAASAQTPPAQSPQTDVPQAQSPQTDVPQAQSPQTEVPQAQSPAQTDPAASIPNQKLDAVAAAMQRIANLKRDYLQLLEDAPPDDQPRIADEASNALEKAVIDQGLSVEEYTAIVAVAQNDPQVRQKIIERMQAPAK
jgi:curli biogenesis system outer membrane secretion channel CsgG